MIDEEGLFEDLDGDGSASCSSSSLTSMAFDVMGFKLAFTIGFAVEYLKLEPTRFEIP